MSIHYGGRGPGHLSRWPKAASGASLFDFYVDSVNGDDGNDGTSEAEAFQTFAAAVAALSSGSDLALIAGSEWGEELSPADDVTIGITGPGSVPVVSGADVVTGWTVNGSNANVYEKSVAHNATGTGRLTVYEDGVLLTRVVDIATCQSTAGSFVDIKGSDGTPVTVQIHPSDSGNPNSNGSSYEVSARLIGVHVSTNSMVTGPLIIEKAISNNGVFEAGANCTVNRVLAKHGTKHNFFLGSGSAGDCIAWANDPPTSYEPSNTMFVSYQDDPSALTYAYDRCFAVKPPTTGVGGTWAYAHGNPNQFQTGAITQCAVIGNLFGGHPGATAIVETGCHWSGLSITSDSAYTINYSTGHGAFSIDGSDTSANSLKQQFVDCSFFFEERYNNSNFNEVFRMSGSSGTRAFTHSSFILPKGGSSNLMANSTASGGTLSCNYSILWAGNGLWLDTDVTYTGDFNVFYAGGLYRDFQAHDGTGYRLTLADWQSNTSQDANSVYLASADQVAGGANAFWLGWSEAAGGTDLATIGPAVGDFRINPSARVYGGDNTAYIGTFADGTTDITEAGARNHWNWNTRGVASGPPSAFPAVPESEADCETYIADPEAWDFYP